MNLLKSSRLARSGSAILAASVLFLTLACGDYASEEARYSGAFGRWLYTSVQVSDEVKRAQTFAEVADYEAVFREQLQTMVRRQIAVNDFLHDTLPPNSLSERHGRIRSVLELYQEPLASFTQPSSAREPLPSLVSRFEAEQAKLLDAIITCYAESPSC